MSSIILGTSGHSLVFIWHSLPCFLFRFGFTVCLFFNFHFSFKSLKICTYTSWHSFGVLSIFFKTFISVLDLYRSVLSQEYSCYKYLVSKGWQRKNNANCLNLPQSISHNCEVGLFNIQVVLLNCQVGRFRVVELLTCGSGICLPVHGP